MLLAGCYIPFPGGYFESTEENYYLAGDSQLELDSALDSAQVVELERRLQSVLLNSGLNYRVSYKHDYTQLKDGTVAASWPDLEVDGYSGSWPGSYFFAGTDPQYAVFEDPFGEEAIPYGSIEVQGDDAVVRLEFPATQAGFGPLVLAGSFNRKDAQTAIDRLRKRDYIYDPQQFGQLGREEFTIEWTASGSRDGVPFSIPVRQQFHVRRQRYSTPI